VAPSPTLVTQSGPGAGSASLGTVTLASTDAIVVRVFAHYVSVTNSKSTTFEFDTSSRNSRMAFPAQTYTDRMVITSSSFTSPPGSYSNVRYRFSFTSTVTSLGDAFYKVKYQIRDGADTSTVATASDSGSLTTSQSWAVQTGTVSGLSASTSYRVRILVEIYNVHQSQTPSLTVNVDDVYIQFEIVTTLTGTASTNFGWSVSKAGNVNADATPYDDVIVGAPDETNGKAFIYYGSSSFDSTADVTITGAISGDKFGYAVASVGDASGDSADDVFVGAPYYDNGASTDAGAAYLFAGSASLGSSLTTANAISYRYGETASDHLGWSVGSSNLDGVGVSELLAGAPHFNAGANTDAGKVYVMRIPEFGEIAISLLGAILPVIVFRRARRRRHTVG